MNSALSLFRSAVLAGLGAGVFSLANAAGTVQVSFDKPAEFSDAGRGAHEREMTMKSIAEYLQSLGAQLPDGQSLHLDVLDIDLAGELRPFPRHSSTEVRVLNGRADAPHVKLRYTLQEGARVLKAGQTTVSHLSYFFASHAGSTAQGDMFYEKRMLQQWFKNTLTPEVNKR
jgi:hypothetical protein